MIKSKDPDLERLLTALISSWRSTAESCAERDSPIYQESMINLDTHKPILTCRYIDFHKTKETFDMDGCKVCPYQGDHVLPVLPNSLLKRVFHSLMNGGLTNLPNYPSPIPRYECKKRFRRIE